MLLDSFLFGLPLFRIGGVFAYIAQVAHWMMEIHFHEFFARSFTFHFSSKNYHILLGFECFLVINKDKVSNFVKFHYY